MLQDMLIIIVQFLGKNIQKPMKDFRLPLCGHESSLKRGYLVTGSLGCFSLNKAMEGYYSG